MTKTQKRLLAGIVTGIILFVATLIAGDDEEKQKELIRVICRGGLEQLAEYGDVNYCTHGPDPVVPKLAQQTEVKAAERGTLCATDGKLVRVFYARLASEPKPTRKEKGKARYVVSGTQALLEESPRWSGERMRVVCYKGRVRVQDLVMTEEVNSTDPRWNPGNDWINLAFLSDGLRRLPSTGYCGIAGMFIDSRPGLENANAVLGHQAIIDCWTNSTTLHELGHTWGAVQHESQFSSKSLHCAIIESIMCYNDGGSYFQEGGQMISGGCPGKVFDCTNSYFHHGREDLWDVANSPWLAKP